MAENKISLSMAGGVKVLNPTPVDPRMRTDTLAAIVNDTTYYVGFSPILDEETGLTYKVVSGDPATGWEFEESGANTKPIDITWVELVALTTRTAGDKFNITDAAPNGVVYGVISLSTDHTFIYWDGVFEQSIKII